MANMRGSAVSARLAREPITRTVSSKGTGIGMRGEVFGGARRRGLGDGFGAVRRRGSGFGFGAG